MYAAIVTTIAKVHLADQTSRRAFPQSSEAHGRAWVRFLM